jgi:hypothetical protein
MNKKIIAASLIFFAIHSFQTVSGRVSVGDKKPRQILLGDGFVFSGIDGQVKCPGSNDVWLFELDKDLSDDRGIVKAGTSLRLLPSSTLEKLIADISRRSAARYRLWGRITKYKGTNYIFPTYFQPVSKLADTRSSGKQDSAAERTAPGVNDPNDVLTMPKEVFEKLKSADVKTDVFVQPIQDDVRAAMDDGRRTKNEGRDLILTDRNALLVMQDTTPGSAGEIFDFNDLILALDAVGRNMPQERFRLLPCEVLEQIQQVQAAAPDAVRFKAAGIKTRYKGREYLLLHKAIRIYNYGNFGR